MNKIKVCAEKMPREFPYDFHRVTCQFNKIHVHDRFCELCIVSDGSAVHAINNQPVRLKKFQAVLMFPDETHYVPQVSPDCKTITIIGDYYQLKQLFSVIDGNRFDKIENLPPPITLSFNNISDSLLFQTLEKLYTVNIFDQNAVEKLIKFVFIYTFQCLDLQYFIRPKYLPEWLSEFLNIIHEEKNISLKVDEMAKLSNYSHSHLIKLFKKYTNQSLIDYIRDVKLDYAANLLATTDYSVLEISNIIGYSSCSNFYKIFCKKYNLSPNSYRAKNRLF